MKILFAVDGSQCSTEAIKTALKMRCPAGTELKVVTAVDLAEPLPSVEGMKEKEVQAAEKLVHEAVEQIRVTHPNATVEGSILNGYACEEILEVCKKWNPDLVMVGSHGRSGISYFLMGSVSRTIFLEAPCAVRIVRARSKEHIDSDTFNVILALDDSEHSKKVVEHALEFPWSPNTTFKCIYVVPEMHQGMLADPEASFGATLAQHYNDMVAGKKAWLEVAAQKLNNAYGKHVAKAEVLLGDPRHVILDLAKSWPADLIMLGSHGRRGIDKLVLGSVSEAVALHAPCSVEMTRIKAPTKPRIHVIV